MTDYIDSFEIGLALDDMTNLEDLEVGMRGPKDKFSPYTDTVTLADGTEKGIGSPICEWNFGILTQAQRDALRDYCTAPAASAVVFIRTRTNESSDAYAYFQAIMVWPHG